MSLITTKKFKKKISKAVKEADDLNRESPRFAFIKLDHVSAGEVRNKGTGYYGIKSIEVDGDGDVIIHMGDYV